MNVRLVLSLFFLFVTLPARSENICSGENIGKLSAPGVTFQSSKDLFSAVGRKTNLHIIGETHFYTDTTLLSRIIAELSSQLPGTKKCMFLEVPKGGLKRFEEMFDENRKRSDLSQEEREKNETWSKYYPAIVTAAEQNKLQIFEIDHPDHITGDKTEDERNEAMAQNASRLLTDSTCDSALFFVGKAHISPLEIRPSVVDLIRRRVLARSHTIWWILASSQTGAWHLGVD